MQHNSTEIYITLVRANFCLFDVPDKQYASYDKINGTFSKIKRLKC